MLAFLRFCWAEHRKREAAARDVRDRYNLALAFNTRHTFRNRREWMCPKCHAVHPHGEMSFLTGLQYPACCGIEAGHRLYKHHATKEGQ